MESCPQKNGQFVNPHTDGIRRSLLDVALWKVGYFDDKKTSSPAPKSFAYPIPEAKLDRRYPIAQWINHSTFLITVDKINILTDPIWSDRCSPVSFIGPKRLHKPPLSLTKLPKIHYVFISHDHYDHLDRRTVKNLHLLFPDITWIVPTGVKKWFASQGIEQVVELSWWEEIILTPGDMPDMQIRATAVPAQHFSGRTKGNFDRTLWAGWVVEFQKNKGRLKRLYFVGDTGYNPHDFKTIGEKWESMDLSLIPIGSYSPRKFMAPVHVEPRDAVRIHKDVGSRLSLGMHWKTFRLSDELFNQPPYDLLMALQSEGLDPSTFLAVDPGYAINW